MRRMDRYKDEDENRINRLEKNQELYYDVANNPKVTNITDVTNANAFEISSKKESQSQRESYQQMRKYGGMEEVPKVKKELDDFNYLYPKKEKRIYDINSVLEDARKNRQETDELESKRKLKYTSYNIFAGINLEELEKYRAEKKNRERTPQEEGIHELMDTIASKTLAGEMSKEETVDLLSDLMATNILDKVVPADEIGGQEKKEEIEEPQIISTQTLMVDQTAEVPAVEEEPKEESLPEELPVEQKEELPVENVDSSEETEKSIEIEPPQDESTQENRTLDKDFYTKSMDLSTKDLDLSDEFEEKGLPIFVKLLIAFLLLSIIAVAVYFVYLRIK